MISIERRINGTVKCHKCLHTWQNIRSLEAEKELAKKDTEIASLKKQVQELIDANNRLYDAVLKDSCPWCGLNNKSNVKRVENETC